ncbi:MAG: hypothetical protein GY771_05740, partial [bacterium]|nr:hypothetical protein [bacterium]
MGGTGSNFREVDSAFVSAIMQEAEAKLLVVRPFRYEDDKTRTQGICFCCDDCCYYFTGKEEMSSCDKGKFRERTDMETCTHCGECEEVCYFGARRMNDGELK